MPTSGLPSAEPPNHADIRSPFRNSTTSTQEANGTDVKPKIEYGFKMLNSIARLSLIAIVFVLKSFSLDLGQAVIVAPSGLNRQETKAVTVLVEEIAKRTQVRLPIQNTLPASGIPAIVVGRTPQLQSVAPRLANGLIPEQAGADGFRVQALNGNVLVAGNDSRGVLFGVGYLLRQMRAERGGILSVPDALKIATVPKQQLRGHQLGYRPKVNAYDGFDVPMWDQYIRDLTIFGTNAIELIPPRSDDADDSPHFPLPKLEMMAEMSRVADDYGLDVWIWYPAMDADYSKPATVEFALKEWEVIYKKLPRIDCIFVPGGDPGHTEPKYLLALLEKQTALLHKYHPKAQMWMSPQSFSAEWMREFYDLMKQEPAWLSGVVYGPQIRVDIPELVAKLPKKYPLRLYPDITHSTQAQFPVPDWDLAYAVTEGREGPNPRPRQERAIFRAYMNYGIGFLTYSEGVNDDYNKFLWSALGWDSDASVLDITREFSRFFIGWKYTDDFAQGLLALEQNWVGPVLTNSGIDITFQQFRRMESEASPQVKQNWRFQQALYRAYYDSYVRDRLLYETALEAQALDELRKARRIGSMLAIEQAHKRLDLALTSPVSGDKRQRIFELAEATFQSIHAQLSVEKYQALALGRGANLDGVDVPLNNRTWLVRRFAEIVKIADERKRLAELDSIVNWTDPGPGGFYDSLGDLSRRTHLVRDTTYESDPMFMRSPLLGFGIKGMGSVTGQDQSFLENPRSWQAHTEALYDTPVRLYYPNLDPAAKYRVRVVYAGDTTRPRLRMVAGDNIEVHDWLSRPVPFHPLEFDIPSAATAKGELHLSISREPGLGGAGRGSQVAEIWLMKAPK